MSLTLAESQQMVDEWIKNVGVRYFSELTNTAVLMEEVGELARIMARRYGDQSFKKNEEDLDLGEEMADILFVLICLANQIGVDLNQAAYRVATWYPTRVGLQNEEIKIPILTLEKSQELVSRHKEYFFKTHSYPDFSELTLTAQFMKSIGELADFIWQHNEPRFKPNKDEFDPEVNFGNVYYNLIHLVNKTGIDLDTAFKKSLDKKTNRDKDRHKENPKLK